MIMASHAHRTPSPSRRYASSRKRPNPSPTGSWCAPSTETSAYSMILPMSVPRRWPLASLSGRVRVVVLVVAADPHLGRVPLVAAEGGAVEEAVVSDHEFEPAGGRRVGQVYGSVVERVGAHRRRLGQVCRGLGPAVLREPAGYWGNAAGQELARRLRRAGDLKVEVVVAAVGGGPREAPPHPPLVGLELVQGRPRDAG